MNDGIGLNFWIAGYRYKPEEPTVTEFLEKLREGWMQYLRDSLNINVFEMPIENIKP